MPPAPPASASAVASSRPPAAASGEAAPSSTDGTETTSSLYDSPPIRRPKRGGLGSSVLLTAAVALGIVGFWFVLGPGRTQWGEQAANPAAPPTQTVAAAPKPAPAPTPEPPAPAEPTATAAESAAAAPTEGAPPPGTQVITVNTKPEGARLYYKGKEVGTTPLKVELAPGEKRSYEVFLRGHLTRKLVVDGSKSEVVIGMRPEQL